MKAIKTKTPDGKMKDAPAPVTYQNIQSEEGPLVYSKEGWKTKITFIVDKNAIEGPNGSGTLYNSWATNDALPARGDDHPYLDGTGGIPHLQADVLTITPFSSTQIKLVVEYAVLSGLTQEPSLENDTKPGLLTLASSCQSTKTSVDYEGSPLTCPLTPGVFNVYGDGSSTPIGNPVSLAVADKQEPSTLLRFQRRETAPVEAGVWIGFTNTSTWTVGGYTYPAESLLCTRIESETQDEGISWVNTYEFQYAKPTPALDDGTPAIPGWRAGCYYQVQNGHAALVSDPTKWVAQAGQIPAALIDGNYVTALPEVFQIYGSAPFAELGLVAGDIMAAKKKAGK
jgi:hypothetical protein